MELSKPMLKALITMCGELEHLEGNWLVGGSCGLLLRNIPLTSEPRDLDIYADEVYLQPIYAGLQCYAIDEPLYSETSIYRSYLSHYNVESVTIEVVGSFQVIVDGASYRTEVSELMQHVDQTTNVGEYHVRLMPLAHEFIFNLLRNRFDRVNPIVKAMQASPDSTIPALREIVERNQFSDAYLRQFNAMLGYSFY